MSDGAGVGVNTFLIQTAVQAFIIAVLWRLIARDATKVRERRGTTPAGISPFAWGALCGLTWVALIPYLIVRNRVAGVTPPTRERNLLLWWIVLALAAAVWSSTDVARDDGNNAAQHAILSGTFVVCALIAWSRDRTVKTTPAHPSE